ncbi:kremen protein 1-like [Scleropages formosus]|uniref:Kringle-containing protein marking the eye and the nose n=1 Tax=Scleropages formosus TaxID=113540 RepID=A0A0P7WZQ0_SCLFO|nr:kremen protein 1-like [Scleropages formosus]
MLFISECYSANGEDYRGRQNQTSLRGGLPCLYWNETLQHPYNTLKFPNGERGLGPHNYCRNPDGDVGPWCYVDDHEDGVYWKYCDVPTCRMPGNLGCFMDTGDPPTLTGSSETSNRLTIERCISYCRERRYQLAGMEAGYACFCGNHLDHSLHGQSPSTECNHVCFGDHTQPCGGDGRIVIFDTRVGSCGGNYTSPSGVLYSPDYPDRYGPGRVCYWTIQVHGATAILFDFTIFDVPDWADMVELLDGYTNQVVARFDGGNPPGNTVNVTTDFAILYFYSDRTNEARGFAVRYQALKSAGGSFVGQPTEEEPEEDSSATDPESEPESDLEATTEWSNDSLSQNSNQVLYVITSTPSEVDRKVPAWTVYAMAALLTLVVIATVTKFLLHVVMRSTAYPTLEAPDTCGQNVASDPWVILYRPSTISFFKKKLKSHQGDLSPLVGH